MTLGLNPLAGGRRRPEPASAGEESRQFTARGCLGSSLLLTRAGGLRASAPPSEGIYAVVLMPHRDVLPPIAARTDYIVTGECFA